MHKFFLFHFILGCAPKTISFQANKMCSIVKVFHSKVLFSLVKTLTLTMAKKRHKRLASTTTDCFFFPIMSKKVTNIAP